VEPEGSLSGSERGLVGCSVLYSLRVCVERGARVTRPFSRPGERGEVERGLERTQFARLLSRPL
jgi:hypothetical protein